MVKVVMEDETPLIERSEESPKNIKSRTRPIQHTNPSFSKGDNLAVHEVQSKDTLQVRLPHPVQIINKYLSHSR